jgi:glycosyltransferase involved in cell wall biosynthesis
VEHLVRALPEIARRIDVEAVVIGDGPERSTLEKLAADHGVTDRVVFLGARPHADMPGLLCSAELAVFPSLMEATSVAALESMACELPVAASRVGGLPEIVDDGVGVLFDPADPGSLARAVSALLESPRLAALGKAARERVVARWTNERLVDRHVAIYEDVLARGRAA